MTSRLGDLDNMVLGDHILHYIRSWASMKDGVMVTWAMDTARVTKIFRYSGDFDREHTRLSAAGWRIVSAGA